MPIATLMMFGVAVCFHLLYFNVNSETSQLLITIIGFALGACLYGPIAIYGVTATESAPTHLSGTAHAVVALSANSINKFLNLLKLILIIFCLVGAITSGLPFSLIAKHFSWSSIFILLEIIISFTVIVMIVTRNMPSQIGKPKTA